MTFEEMVDAKFAEARRLMVERHRKYGPHNIGRTGLAGVVVRLGDKQARLEQAVLFGGGDHAGDESLRDTFMDALNYACIGLCVLGGQWTQTTCPPLEKP